MTRWEQMQLISFLSKVKIFNFDQYIYTKKINSFLKFQAELRIVVCDDSEKALSLMKSKTNLEYIIIIEKINEETRHLAVDLGIKLFTLDEFKEIGQKYRKKPNVIIIRMKKISI